VSVLLGVLASLAAICALSVGTVVLTVWLVSRRIRRSRRLNTAVLRTRANLSWGSRHTLASLRLQLAEALGSGRDAVDIAVKSNGRRGDLPRLYRRLEDEGKTLDIRLRLLESERNTAIVAGELPALSRSVNQVVDLVGRVRGSVSAGLGGRSDATMVALRHDIELEVAALHAGLVELRRMDASDSSPTDGRPRPAADRLETKGVQA
jgi:hypothetical protein